MLREAPSLIAAALGLTPETFESKKDFLLIQDEDLANIAAIRASLPEIPDTMFDSFYDHLLHFEQTRSIFTGQSQIENLKNKQKIYFSRLLSGKYDYDYLLDRLSVGDVHCKLNIVPLWYIGSYSKYIFGILDVLRAMPGVDTDSVFIMFKSLLKVIFLDIIITLESYHYGKYKMQKELEELTVTDHLTGMLNMRKFKEVIVHEFQRSERYKYGVAVLFIDIDNFKKVNDTLGHAIGDTVLVALAGILKNCVRVTDYVFRYGGEEFLVLLPETDLEHALLVGEKLRAKVADSVFEGVGNATISLGVAMRQPEDTPESLVARADGNMYDAKRRGKNRVCC